MTFAIAICIALLTTVTTAQPGCPEICFRAENRARNSCNDAPSFCIVSSCTIPANARRGPISGFICTASSSNSATPDVSAAPSPSAAPLTFLPPFIAPSEGSECPDQCRRGASRALRDCDDAPSFCRVRPCLRPPRRQGQEPTPGQACVDGRIPEGPEAPEGTPSPSLTPSVSPTASASATVSPSPSVSATPTISASPSGTVSPLPEAPTPAPALRCPEICSRNLREVVESCEEAPSFCRLRNCNLTPPGARRSLIAFICTEHSF